MPVDHDHSPTLSTAAEADIIGYSAVAPAAIVALLLGLASFFAIGNLLLLIVPALALLASAYALSQIGRSDGALSGRWAAMAGLALALLFTSAAIARSATRAWQMRSEAQALADTWLKLVRDGKLHEAHQWHLSAGERQLPGTSLAQFYHDSQPAQQELDQFYSVPPLSKLVHAPRDAELRYERVVEQLRLDKSDRVALLYWLMESDAHESTTPLVVVTERIANDKAPGAQWQVVAVVEPKEEPPTP